MLTQQGLKAAAVQPQGYGRLAAAAPEHQPFLLLAELALEGFGCLQQAAIEGHAGAEVGGDPAVEIPAAQGQACLADYAGAAQGLAAGTQITAS